MSVEAVSWVLNHAPASGTDKVVLLGIANHASPAGRDAWPSVATLARYANVTGRAVQQSIARLSEAGLVDVELGAGGDRRTARNRRPNRYRILMTGAKPASPQETARDESECTPVEAKPVAPQRAVGVKPSASRGEPQRAVGVKPSASRGEADFTQTILEPSVEPSVETIRPSLELVPVVALVAPPATPARKPNPIFDALVEACCWRYDEMTEVQRRATGVAAAQLDKVKATPADVHQRAAEYRERMPTMSFTPHALAKHWASLTPRARPNGTRILSKSEQSAKNVIERRKAARGT